MKAIVLITFLLLSLSGIGQTNYQKGMQKALDLWAADKPSEAINLFERIAAADPDKWLPPYYVSYILTINGFKEKDEAMLKTKMEKAQNYMNDAKTIKKNEVELILLDALIHTVWVAFDGSVYGMKYGGKITKMYQEAISLAPNNPRVILNKAEWDIGGAKFFGNPTEPYCNDIQRAIELFIDYKPAEEFYPSGGTERAKQLFLTNCN